MIEKGISIITDRSFAIYSDVLFNHWKLSVIERASSKNSEDFNNYWNGQIFFFKFVFI